MMDNLRAAANHVVLKIILGLIVLSFVLTGVGNYLIGGSSDYAARERSARTGRNPQTGKEISIPAAKVPGFRAGKSLKDAVNG